jgi:hypothetical protein
MNQLAELTQNFDRVTHKIHPVKCWYFKVLNLVSETKFLRKTSFFRGGFCDTRARSECVEIYNYYNRNFKLILLIILCHLLNHDTLVLSQWFWCHFVRGMKSWHECNYWTAVFPFITDDVVLIISTSHSLD